MSTNIWKPVGMLSTTFRLGDHPRIKSRLVSMSARQESTGNLVPSSHPVFPSNGDGQALHDCGGVGAYSTAPDYMKLLLALLRKDPSKTIFQHPQTVRELFSPQIALDTPPGRALNQILLAPDQVKSTSALPLSLIPKATSLSWALGGLLDLSSSPSSSEQNHPYPLLWTGLPNLVWWIDRSIGVAGVYFSQLIPSSDPISAKLFLTFQRDFAGEATRRRREENNIPS